MKTLNLVAACLTLALFASCATTTGTVARNEEGYPGRRADPLIFPRPTGDEAEYLSSGSTDASGVPLSAFGPVADPFLDEITQKARWHRLQGDPTKAAALYAYAVWYAATNDLPLTIGQLNGILELRAYAVSELERPVTAARIFDFRIEMLRDAEDWRGRLPATLTVHDNLTEPDRTRQVGFAYRGRALERTLSGDFDGAWADIEAAVERFERIEATDAILDAYEIYITNATLKDAYSHVPIAFQAFRHAYGSGGGRQSREEMEQAVGVWYFSAIAYAQLGDLVAAYEALNEIVGLADLTRYDSQSIRQVRSVRDQLRPLVAATQQPEPDGLVGFIMAGDVTTIRRRLADGADPNTIDDDGLSPLMHSTGISAQMVQTLLDAGADPNARGVNGVTALALVGGYSDNVDIARMLLAAGADPNARSNAGWTTVMLAARRGTSPEMIRLLIQAGADPNIRTAAGVTALEVARSSGNAAIIRLLQEAGAR